LIFLITFFISNTFILSWDNRIALQSYSRKSGQAGAWAACRRRRRRLACLAGRLAAATAWA